MTVIRISFCMWVYQDSMRQHYVLNLHIRLTRRHLARRPCLMIFIFGLAKIRLRMKLAQLLIKLSNSMIVSRFFTDWVGRNCSYEFNQRFGRCSCTVQRSAGFRIVPIFVVFSTDVRLLTGRCLHWISSRLFPPSS